MGFEIYLMTIFGCQTFHTSDQLFVDGKESMFNRVVLETVVCCLKQKERACRR